MGVAGLVLRISLGGPRQGLAAEGLAVAESTFPGIVLPFLGMMVTYMLVNRMLVSVAVAWSSDRRYLNVLREDWFYRERFFDDLALFLLSPLVVISYEAIRYVGLLLFYAPLRIIYESSLRYVELRSAQDLLIHTERMAAKGEIAAEIGHELRKSAGGDQRQGPDADPRRRETAVRERVTPRADHPRTGPPHGGDVEGFDGLLRAPSSRSSGSI